MDGVALNLHSFYSGTERIFELIAGNVDDMLPKGENWHQALLKQMAEEITEVRPAVISDSVRLDLDEYRGCRHIVRNVYTYKFDSARIEKLTEKAGRLFTRLRAELLAFADLDVKYHARPFLCTILVHPVPLSVWVASGVGGQVIGLWEKQIHGPNLFSVPSVFPYATPLLAPLVFSFPSGSGVAWSQPRVGTGSLEHYQ